MLSSATDKASQETWPASVPYSTESENPRVILSLTLSAETSESEIHGLVCEIKGSSMNFTVNCSETYQPQTSEFTQWQIHPFNTHTSAEKKNVQ